MRSAAEIIRSASSTFFLAQALGAEAFDWGNERVYPRACMGCGVVLLYLDRLPAVAGEYKTARDATVAPKAQPAHFKS